MDGCEVLRIYETIPASGIGSPWGVRGPTLSTIEFVLFLVDSYPS